MYDNFFVIIPFSELKVFFIFVTILFPKACFKACVCFYPPEKKKKIYRLWLHTKIMLLLKHLVNKIIKCYRTFRPDSITHIWHHFFLISTIYRKLSIIFNQQSKKYINFPLFWFFIGDCPSDFNLPRDSAL